MEEKKKEFAQSTLFLALESCQFNELNVFGADVKTTSRAADPKAAGGSYRKRPRREENLKRDPNAPRPNRTGYNFFFAEQCSKYKAMHPGVTGLELSRILGHAWNILTEHEKVVSARNSINCC